MPPGTPRFRAARVGQVKVAAEAARRFLFARHFLAPARSVGGGLDGVLAVFRTAFTRDQRTIPADRLHLQVDNYLVSRE